MTDPNVICQRCNVSDYSTSPAGPHLKATCNQCHRYIKFVTQSAAPPELMPFGKHQGKPLPEIPLDYWKFMLQNNHLKGTIKNFAMEAIKASNNEPTIN